MTNAPIAIRIPSLLLLTLVACGTSTALTTDTGDASVDAPCTIGAYQCSSDALSVCIASSWHLLDQCGAGLCDPNAGRCMACAGGTKTCSGGQLVTCSADGSSSTTTNCPSYASMCSGGACVQCAQDSDCPSTDCQAATCSNNLCSLTPKAQGTTCGVSGQCDGTGACNKCTPGTTQCVGTNLMICDATATYQVVACPSATPACNGTVCVQCFSNSDCISSSSCQVGQCVANSCQFSQASPGTSCNNNGGQCDVNGSCVSAPGDGQIGEIGADSTSDSSPYFDGADTENGSETVTTDVSAIDSLETMSDTADAACGTGTYQCSGSSLQICAGGWLTWQTCNSAALCDANLQKCDQCVPSTVACTDNKTVTNCNTDGTILSQVNCTGNAPQCNGGKCVACNVDSDCPTSTQDCQKMVCQNNTCTTQNLPSGSVCSTGGTCNASGVCGACGTGALRCNNNWVQFCTSSESWSNVLQCSGTTPDCLAGSCVGCASDGDCATGNSCISSSCNSATHTCTNTNVANGTSCSNGNVCNGSGTCVQSQVCTPGSFQCVGDTLQSCSSDGTAWNSIVTCNTGMCDAVDHRCNVCSPNTQSCSTNTVVVCNSQGQIASQFACTGGTPYCGGGNCYQCTQSSQCGAASDDCHYESCDSNSCAQHTYSDGTTCSGGTCSNGTCLCVPGTSKCVGDAVYTCNTGRSWYATATCAGGTPICTLNSSSEAVCVQCAANTDCAFDGNACHVPTCISNTCYQVEKVCSNGLTCSGGICQ